MSTRQLMPNQTHHDFFRDSAIYFDKTKKGLQNNFGDQGQDGPRICVITTETTTTSGHETKRRRLRRPRRRVEEAESDLGGCNKVST